MRGLLERLWFRRSRSRSLRILLIDDYVPDRSIGAGVPRMAELLRAMSAAGAKVTLWPIFGRIAAGLRIDTFGASIARGARTRTNAELSGLRRFRHFLKHHGPSFDGIIVSRPHNMRTFRALVTQPPAISSLPPIFYDAEALYAEREIVMHEVLGSPLAASEARRMLDDELSLAADAAVVLTVNQVSANAFAMAGHRDVRVLGHSVVPQPTSQTFEQRDGFLFVGPTRVDREPNSDAVVWFCDHVLPSLRVQLQRDVSLTLVGMVGASTVLAREGAGLDIRGAVADLADVYSRARVFVAPTRFAAGIPLKVYDAAAHGVPTVITPILARGIGWMHGRDTLVAASPEEFASACYRLHEDRELWEKVRSSALDRIRADCSVSQFDQTVATLLNDIAEQKMLSTVL